VRLPDVGERLELRMYHPEMIVWLAVWMAVGWVHSLGLPVEFA